VFLDTLNREIFVSRNIFIFYENISPYKNIEGSSFYYENYIKKNYFNFLLDPTKYNTSNRVQIEEIETNQYNVDQNCNNDNRYS